MRREESELCSVEISVRQIFLMSVSYYHLHEVLNEMNGKGIGTGSCLKTSRET